MRRTLTTSYGATIHYTSDDRPRRRIRRGGAGSAVGAAADRAAPGWQQRLLPDQAFGATRGKRDVIVRPAFHEFLDQIGADADLMRQLGSQATTMIRANGGRAPGTR